MTFFRQYISPLLIVLIFLVALVAVSARIFLPSDMAAPAPIEEDDLAIGKVTATHFSKAKAPNLPISVNP
jgi:hypothetical protein